jgi:hypothetical protein
MVSTETAPTIPSRNSRPALAFGPSHVQGQRRVFWLRRWESAEMRARALTVTNAGAVCLRGAGGPVLAYALGRGEP